MSSDPASVIAVQESVLAGDPTTVSALPPQVGASWLRCRDHGVDPAAQTPPSAGEDELTAWRAHPLAAALPVVRRLLVDHAADEGLVVAVTDAAGRLLWVEGHSGALRQAERIGFHPGTWWDEAHAGTNAPALALVTDAPVRVRAAEHWCSPVQSWSCSAAPVHDPGTGRLLGALDVTGRSQAATSTALALVQAAAIAVERELALLSLRSEPVSTTALHLTTMGADAPALRIGGRTLRLSQRHGEVLLLLAQHPEGLTGEQLAVLLDERELDPVTVRAELSRLRKVVGEEVLLGRPYRLSLPITTDLEHVRMLLDRGQIADAVAQMSGPVLGRSSAPAVVEAREALAWEAREALLRSSDAQLLLRWADSGWGVDDPLVWRALTTLLPPGPARSRATGHAALLERRMR